MRCTLMHKHTAVAELELDHATGFIRKIDAIYAPQHLPVATLSPNGAPDRAALNAWWTDRSIPASRSGVQEALDTLELASTKQLLVRCYGLSLSDHYWVCPQGSNLTWDMVNFFDNPFSDDIGDVLWGQPKRGADFDFSSPDNTSDGFLKKRWKIIGGKRCLVKGGSNPFQQQPFNEVIATRIMEQLGIPHIPYSLLWSNGLPYSVCEDFVTPDTELVSAWRIVQTEKKGNSVSVYQHFTSRCQALGASGIVPALDRMLVLDYLIANEDRHLNNFGLLRDPETLKWLGMAPIYDSGSSLGYDKVAGQIRAGRDIMCKPFKQRHEDQVKLVSSFDWINFDALSGIGTLIRDTLSEAQAIDFVGRDRVEAIADSVEQRVRTLQDMAMTQRPSNTVDSTLGDVTENTAQDYGPGMSM